MFAVTLLTRCVGRHRRAASGAATVHQRQGSATDKGQGVVPPPSPPSTSSNLNAAADAVSSAIVAMASTTPFLRSLPPDVYVMYDPESQWRHWSLVVDGACGATPPFTQATLLLRSFLQHRGMNGAAATASSGEVASISDGCALVCLPHARKVSDSHRYVERLRKIAHENGCETVLSSKQFKCVVLPEFNPWVGNTFGLLQQLNPDLRIATGPTMAAFLSDSTFFNGVRDVLRRNAFARGFELEEMPFANVRADAIDVVGGAGGSASGSNVDVVAGEHRTLSFVTGDAVATSPSKQSSPAHFQYKPLLVYDRSTRSIIAGPSTVGVRLPWLQHIEPSLNLDALLPMPTPFHIAATGGGSTEPKGTGGKSGGSATTASPLLSSWRPEASLASTLRALTQFPHVQRVVSTAYGELSHDREDVIAQLTASTEALLGLRKRLAAKHYELGVANANDAVRCTDTLWQPLGRKVFDEVLYSKRKVVGEVAADGGNDASGVANISSSSSSSNSTARAAAARQVVEAHVVEPIAKALAYAALVLAPTEGATFSAARTQDRGPTSGDSTKDEAPQSHVSADRAHTASSIATLKQLFVQRGFDALCSTLDKEEIDVDVFLSMRQDELSKTFQVTFGLTKKLQLLQNEVKARMAKNLS